MVCKTLFTSAFLVFAAVFSASAASVPADFTSLVKSAGPAVININTEKTVEVRSRGPFPFPSNPLFDEFFRGMPGMPGQEGSQAPRQRKQRSLGSGFIISADGYIVTNHHVVNGADSIQVSFGDKNDKEETYKAQLIGSDKLTDLAVLKITPKKELPFLKLGDSDAINVGEWVIAIGNPFGLDHTVTAGIISAKGRKIRSNPFDSFLQTDASINPGNSGGPLLNMAGEGIGINAAIIANGQGIGFAIPSNMAKEIIETLRTDKKVSRGWIGVTIQSLDEVGAKALGLPNSKGALIGDVIPNQPADKAGIKSGDIILTVNGEEVADSGDLSRKVAAIKPGEKAMISVWRNGSKKNLTVKIAERQSEKPSGKAAEEGTKTPVDSMLGISVRKVTNEDAKRLRLEKTSGLLVVRVEDNSKAEEADIRTGDVILAANGKTVSDEKELVSILEDQGKSRGAVMLHISRMGNKAFRTVEITAK
jgi:serine protease Do